MRSWFIRSVLSVVLLASLALPTAGAPATPICTWTGAVSDDYAVAGNYDCLMPPGPDSQIVIAPAARYPRVRTQGAAGMLTILGGAMLELAPNASLTIASGLTLNQAAELFPGANSTITLRNGNWTNNGGSVSTAGAWTAVFDGQGNQAITGMRSSQTFSHLTLNNTSMTMPEVAFGGNTTTVNVNRTLTLNRDTALNTGPSGTLALKGDLVNNGGGLRGRAAVVFEGANDQAIGGSLSAPVFPGPVTINKSLGALTAGSGLAGLSFDGPLTIVAGTLRLAGKDLTTNSTTTVGPGTLDISGGDWTANGPVTLGPGGVFIPGLSTVQFNASAWTNNGGQVDNSTPWTLVLNSSSDQLINGTATTQRFGNVTLNNRGMSMPEVQISGGTTTVDISGALTLNQDATFDAGAAHTLGIGGDLLNNGGNLQGSDQLTTKFNGAGPQAIGGTVASLTFPGNLTVGKPSGEVTLSGNTQQVVVNRGFDVWGGSFSLGPGTLTTAGPAEVLKGGTLNLGSGVWNANSSVYFETGGTFNAGWGTLNFGGSYIAFYGGTVNPGASTTNFLLTGNHRISGSGVASFHHVNFHNQTMGPVGFRVGSSSSGPSALIATGNVYIGEDVTFNAGTATDILIGGDFGNDGVFVPGASTVTFNGSAPLGGHRPDAAQTIGGAQSTTFNHLTVDNPAGVVLGASQEVNGVLNLKTGGLTTAAYTLTLGSAAAVTGTHQVLGAVQRTQVFTAGVPYSFGGANETITFAEVGSVTGLTVNTQNAAPDGLRPAISRTVAITPVGGGYTATLRLPYLDAELNGIGEADLRLWRRGAVRWETGDPQVVNAAENWVEQSGITVFSTWALASASARQGGRLYLPLALR